MKFIASSLLILFSLLSFAQDDCLLDIDKNNIPRTLVIDQADIISSSTEKQLQNILVAFSNETSNQILVVTVNTLCGYDKAAFSYTLGEKWGVGQDEFDNGIVLMVKPHGSQGDRHTFIAVGRGLEGAIPDAIAKRIVTNELIPHFKTGDFEGGISSGLTVLMGLAKGEINSDEYAKKGGKKAPVFSIIFILLIIFLVFWTNVKRVQRNAVGKDLSFWAAIWLLSQSGHRRGGGWNDFHSGGGSFGGGGGFGGFGGGSFGGGGAGGSW